MPRKIEKTNVDQHLKSIVKSSCFHERSRLIKFSLIVLFLFGVAYSLYSYGDTIRLPGEDITNKMTSVGILIKYTENGLFKFVGRILAGVCIFATAWNVKEMRIGPAILCIIAALLFGTAQTWVKNIFSIGDGEAIFSQLNPQYLNPSYKDAFLNQKDGFYA